MKDIQRELEDTQTAQEELLATANESERKAKDMEASMMQMQEVSSHTREPMISQVKVKLT